MNSSTTLSADVKKELSELQEITGRTSAATIEMAKQYHTTVLSLGYAGAFAIWTFCKDFMPENSQILTALLLGTSLIIYVFFEIFNVTIIGVLAIRSNIMAQPTPIPDTLEELNTYVSALKAKNAKFQRSMRGLAIGSIIIWPFFFISSLLCGLAGVLLLMYNFIAHLVPAYFPFFPA